MKAKNQDPTRIMFAGDWHGNVEHARWCFRAAEQAGADQIVQCGDFGYWPHYVQGDRYMRLVAHEIRKTGIPVWWVDGNHDNHDWLDALPRDPDGLVTLDENFRYIPRGARWEWGGVRFLGHGGAWSVDEHHRVVGETMWAQEKITEAQIAAVSDEPTDVLVTHEVPYGKRLSYKDDLDISINQRILMRKLVDKVSPRLVVSGHHHVRNTFHIGDTQVEVVSRDTQKGRSVLAINLADIQERSHAVHNPV